MIFWAWVMCTAPGRIGGPERGLLPLDGSYTAGCKEPTMSAHDTPPALPGQDEVEYRGVPDFPAYRVGTDGSVWSRLAQKGVDRRAGECLRLGNEWRRLRPQPQRQGYLVVCLFRDGHRYWRTVHSLVLRSFVGPRPRGLVARHWDRDRANNRLSNLSYSTQADNLADRKRHGTETTGSRNGRAKLTEGIVRWMRRSYSAGGITQETLALAAGVHQTTVSAVILNESWKDIDP